MNLLNNDELNEMFRRFQENNPDPKPELDSVNNYTFLVAVVLSAQATDKSVNKATKPLFTMADTPEKMLELGEEKLIDYIKPVGLSKAKSKNIMALSKKIIEDFNGQVPDNRKDLMSLPGVGRKTANVVLNVIFHQPTMPVDTHLLRVCPKIGIAAGTTPEQVEAGLEARVPAQFGLHAHHWILLHGRYVCTARNPHCEDCFLSDLCKHNE